MHTILCEECSFVCISLLLRLTASSETASASLSGPDTVCQNDTMTVTFNLNGSRIYGTFDALSYDSTRLQFTGTKQTVISPWLALWALVSACS